MDDHDEFGNTVVVGKGKEPTGNAALKAIVVMDESARTHTLPAAGDVRIGRFTGSTVVIDHDTLSRLHAILHVGPFMTIEDLGSANGTFVREVRIKPGQLVPVSIGDVVRLGSVLFILLKDIRSTK